MEADPDWLNISRYGGGAFAAPASAEVSRPPPPFGSEAFKGNTMQRTPFILLVLLTMSAASRAATDDADSFMGVGWGWVLALSLYAVLGVIVLSMCKIAAASDALEDRTYAATLRQAGARQGLSDFDLQNAGHPSLWPESLGHLNFADFEAQFLDVHILSSDEIVVRVDATVTRA